MNFYRNQKRTSSRKSILVLCRGLLRRASSEIGYLLCRVGSLITIKASRPYHPLGGRKKPFLARPQEAFESRWMFVSDALKKYEAKNFLDIGCAEGYYVRKAAEECGVFAIGIDQNIQRLRTSSACSFIDNDWKPGFVGMQVDARIIHAIPNFDVIACMSLMHHIIHRHGIEEAREFLIAVSKKTRKCMLFDMGGPDEKGNEWAGSLSMFSGDIVENIASFVRSCNFSHVEHVGWSTGYGGSVQRPFFIAEPPQSRKRS